MYMDIIIYFTIYIIITIIIYHIYIYIKLYAVRLCVRMHVSDTNVQYQVNKPDDVYVHCPSYREPSGKIKVSAGSSKKNDAEVKFNMWFVSL